MAARIYDYLGDNGENPIAAWIAGHPKDRGRINAKIDMLMRYGDQTLPSFVTPAVGSGAIKEIVINGERALRILICRGPIEIGRSSDGKKSSPWAAPEFTILLGAEERDCKYVPSDAVQQAELRRKTIMHDPKRRVAHVHVGSTGNK